MLSISHDSHMKRKYSKKRSRIEQFSSSRATPITMFSRWPRCTSTTHGRTICLLAFSKTYQIATKKLKNYFSSVIHLGISRIWYKVWQRRSCDNNKTILSRIFDNNLVMKTTNEIWIVLGINLNTRDIGSNIEDCM